MSPLHHRIEKRTNKRIKGVCKRGLTERNEMMVCPSLNLSSERTDSAIWGVTPRQTMSHVSRTAWLSDAIVTWSAGARILNQGHCRSQRDVWPKLWHLARPLTRSCGFSVGSVVQDKGRRVKKDCVGLVQICFEEARLDARVWDVWLRGLLRKRALSSSALSSAGRGSRGKGLGFGVQGLSSVIRF